MHKWPSCPNCNCRPDDGWFSGSWFNVFECNSCRGWFCYKCGYYGKDCPHCGAKEKRSVGEVHR